MSTKFPTVEVIVKGEPCVLVHTDDLVGLSDGKCTTCPFTETCSGVAFDAKCTKLAERAMLELPTAHFIVRLVDYVTMRLEGANDS